MNILKAAIAIGWRGDAQVSRVKIAPGAGNIPRLTVACKQRALDLEPDHDVQVVCHLIRFDSNEPRLCPVHRFPELFASHARLAKRCLKRWEEMTPEPIAPSDEIFPQPRLGLVNAE